MPWDSVDKWRDEDYGSVDSSVTSDALGTDVRSLTEPEIGSENWHRLNGPEERDNPKGKGAWYFTYTRECPVCGRGDTTRERRHDEKPEFVGDRYEFVQHWDGCNV